MARYSVSLFFALFLAACGGGEGEKNLPQGVAELQKVFTVSAAPCHFSSSREDAQCRLVNVDTDVQFQEVETGGPNRWSVTVKYRQKTVYHDEHFVSIGISHSFVSSGQYVLIVNPWSKVTAYPRIFVNGQHVEHPGFIKDWPLEVREYGEGWLILQSAAPYYIPGPRCVWMMYNIQTGALKEYGGAECS